MNTTKQTIDWHAVTPADQKRIRCDESLDWNVRCSKPATLCQHPPTGGGGFFYYCDEHAAKHGYTDQAAKLDEGALRACIGSETAPGAQMSDADWLIATKERDA